MWFNSYYYLNGKRSYSIEMLCRSIITKGELIDEFQIFKLYYYDNNYYVAVYKDIENVTNLSVYYPFMNKNYPYYPFHFIQDNKEVIRKDKVIRKRKSIIECYR